MSAFRLQTLCCAATMSLEVALIGCAAKAPVTAAQMCLAGPSWRHLQTPPLNATTLYGSVANRPGIVDAPKASRDYWFESDSGSLRLCRQRTDARNLCGSANIEFTLVEGRWRPQAGVDVPVCYPSREIKKPSNTRSES